MRKLLLVLFTVVTALVVINAVRRALASDETRIRWILEGMADGFDDGSAARAVEGLSRDWHDGGSGTDREQLRGGLMLLFRDQRVGRSGELRYRVELPPESLAITFDPEQPAVARVECVARFLDKGDEDRLAWEVAVDAELVHEEPGWRITRTQHRTLSGVPLARGL